MSEAPAEPGLARAWMLLVASSALYFLSDNEADNDLWVHLFSGRVVLAGGPPHADVFSYTAAGAAWIDHEWLTQAVFAAVYDVAGSTGLWLLKLAVALLTAWLVWLPITRRSRSPWVRGGAMVLALAVLARGYPVRPQIVTYLGVAALLAWLDRDRPITGRAIAATALAFALWANAHGAVIVGLGIVGLYVLLSPRSREGEAGGEGDEKLQAPLNRPHPTPLPRASGSARFALAAAAVLGACLTPYGPRLFLYIASELTVPHPLTEWQPVQLGDAAHAPFLLMFALLVVTLPFARTLRRRPWWAVLVAGVALMALRHQRHTPLFALCAAAPLAEQLDGALGWLRARTAFRLSPAATGIVAAALIGLAAVQVASAGARLWRDGARIVFAARDYPLGAVRHLLVNGVRGNLALPLDWGGYALWHAAPAVKVSLDGRFATVYGPSVVEDNFAFFRADGDPAAARLLDAYDTTLVLAPRGVPTPLDSRPGWQVIYTDEVAALWARSGSPAAAASQAPSGWRHFP